MNDFSTPWPVWRVDLKWVFTIPFTLALILVLLAAVMFTASGSSRARGTYGEMLQPGLADPEFRADLALVGPEMLAFLESPEFTTLVDDDPAAFQSGVEALTGWSNRTRVRWVRSWPWTAWSHSSKTSWGLRCR